MTIEFAAAGIFVEVEKPITVFYGRNVVGTFSADLVVERKVILELKSAEALHPADEAQLLNYLRATDIELGLLFNFGRQPEFKRKYFSNEKKSKQDNSQTGILRDLFSDDPPKSAQIRLIRPIRVLNVVAVSAGWVTRITDIPVPSPADT